MTDSPPSRSLGGAAETIKFGTFCSGIGAPEAAWGPLGWKPQFFSELGNSMCVNVVRWIGERIQQVNALAETEVTK